MDRPINKIFSEITNKREREKNIMYMNNYIENGVNKINNNNNNSTTGRDRDVRTYPEIKSTVEDWY